MEKKEGFGKSNESFASGGSKKSVEETSEAEGDDSGISIMMFHNIFAVPVPGQLWPPFAVPMPGLLRPSLSDYQLLGRVLAEMLSRSVAEFWAAREKEKPGTSKTSPTGKGDQGEASGSERMDGSQDKLTIVLREQWKAMAPKNKLHTRRWPFHIVFVNCIDLKRGSLPDKSITAVRQIQSDSMRYFDDIVSHFVVGKDGLVYEGRGWGNEGEFETMINIDFIGVHVGELPSPKELAACKRLIQEGVNQGKIERGYMLITHKFHRLYHELMKWEHFVPFPIP